MLADVGVSSGDISKLLGKTERAVQLKLQDERMRAERAKPKPTKK